MWIRGVLTFVAGVSVAAAGQLEWGRDHVGQLVPDCVHGDECLFCQRNTISATWQPNGA